MFNALRGRIGRCSWSVGLAIVTIQCLQFVQPRPTRAAERIVISYGMIERSIAIDDLQSFVDDGSLSPQLQEYVRILGLSSEQLASAREILTTPAELSVVAVAQFLYTPQGKLLLKQVSEVIQTSTRQAGFSATRAALILAAADGESGLTILNFLEKYPGEMIRVDIGRGLALAQDVNRAIVLSRQAIELVQSQAEAVAMANPLDDGAYAKALDQLQMLDRYEVDVVNLPVPEMSVPVRMFLPRSPSIEVLPPRNVPLIVISHGLGSNRDTYRYLAERLARAGFVVAAIEHSGSNDQQLINLQDGLVDAVVDDAEFARRPQEVSRALDAIATANRTGSLRGLIDLRQIGLIGQSFGGYTALATAGATFSQEAYNQSCPPEPPVFNLSLLLQCQAPLPDDSIGSLVDPRIDAVFVINPIGSALFGEAGLGQVSQPLMMVSGTADTVAPAVPEQIRPYTWLQGDDQYLLLLAGATHFSAVGITPADSQPIPVPPEIIGPQPELAQSYMETFSVAFFQRYLNQDAQFAPLLSASFAQRLGREPITLSLIDALSPEQLNEAIQGGIFEESAASVLTAP